jgi:hypothetical protein
LTPEEQADDEYLTALFPLILDSTGRLTHGGAGQIVFAAALSGDPVERGQVVNGFQDDFTGATRDPNWKVLGPGGDLYRQANGLNGVQSGEAIGALGGGVVLFGWPLVRRVGGGRLRCVLRR